VTFDILLVALAALVLSNVVLLVAAARSGTLGRARQEVETGPVSTGAAVRDRAGLIATAPEKGAPLPPANRDAATEPVSVEGDASTAVPPTREAEAPARLVPPPAADPPETGLPEPKPNASVTASAAAVQTVGRSRKSPTASATAGRSESRGSGTASTGGARGGRGRRFTLPSIEVDHARTERVVLSLLTGDDEVPPGEMVDAWERMVGTDADSTARRSAVVVALTLDGIDRLTEAAGRDSAERLVGTVLDAIRRSARASDRVASVGRGHFRVLLVDADEAVATRFVGRVRESTERRLVMAAAPVTLAAGWSEAASADRLEGAVRAAVERRRVDAASGRRHTGGRNPA
jgi:GGDEF domain-containing protein